MPKKKSPNSVRIRNSAAEFLTFAYQTGGDGVEVRVQDGTIWLSQKNMGELFTTSSDNSGLLRDYTLRGYVMDRKRMENGAFLGEDSGGVAAHNRWLLALIAWVRIFGRGCITTPKRPLYC